MIPPRSALLPEAVVKANGEIYRLLQALWWVVVHEHVLQRLRQSLIEAAAQGDIVPSALGSEDPELDRVLCDAEGSLS